MGKDWLEMKYHPAMKEVEFKRGSGKSEQKITKDSCLYKYMSQDFVLQDHGNQFFDDIKKAFDGLTEIEIRVSTTKLDYEDFEQMVNFYNEKSENFKITATLLAELPNMKKTFEQVMDFGNEVVETLDEKKGSLFHFGAKHRSQSGDLVTEKVKEAKEGIDTEIQKINRKMESLESSNVNLCFAGVYSSGKSSLINALLGYRILPESKGSKTAKMFVITSPGEDGQVSADFDIVNTSSRLIWNNGSNRFEFEFGPAESAVRTEIQQTMNGAAGSPRHEQLYKIIETLNSERDVSETLYIKFPIELDSPSVKFTIYDTPGTDSNSAKHKEVLNEALASQSQSILILVCKPDKMEGEGTNALLSCIKDMEKKEGENDNRCGTFFCSYDPCG